MVPQKISHGAASRILSSGICATINLDPPWQFGMSLEQFLMAVAVKENVSPEVMLEDPKDLLEKPPPRPETPREVEDEAATTARNLKNKLARD